MSSRYYLSDLSQDSRGRWRPSLVASEAWANEVEPAQQNIQSGSTNGTPDILWCFMVVGAQNHQALSEVEGVDLMPDYPLDGRISAMPQDTRTALMTTLEGRGVDTNPITGSDAYRDLLGVIAAHLGNTDFDADAFTV